jgi:hypothetical protein
MNFRPVRCLELVQHLPGVSDTCQLINWCHASRCSATLWICLHLRCGLERRADAAAVKVCSSVQHCLPLRVWRAPGCNASFICKCTLVCGNGCEL